MTILTASDIYWVLMIPKFGSLLAIFAFISVLAAGISIAAYGIAMDDVSPFLKRFGTDDGEPNPGYEKISKHYKWLKNLSKTFACLFVVCMIGSNLIPSREHLVAMYLIPPIVNNTEVQKIPGNLVDLLNKEMQSVIAGLDEKKEQKKEDPKKEEASVKKEGMLPDPDEKTKQMVIDAATAAAKSVLEKKL